MPDLAFPNDPEPKTTEPHDPEPKTPEVSKEELKQEILEELKARANEDETKENEEPKKEDSSKEVEAETLSTTGVKPPERKPLPPPNSKEKFESPDESNELKQCGDDDLSDIEKNLCAFAASKRKSG